MRLLLLTSALMITAACAAGDIAESEQDATAVDGGEQEGLANPGTNDGGDLQACATLEVAAEPRTLDVVVLLDRSLSMKSKDKWEGTTDALSSFFNDPSSEGINASLVFFPTPGELSTDGDQCDVGQYDPEASPHVPLGALPAHASVLDYAISTQEPAGFTPTLHALQGIVPFATERQAQHPDHEVVIVVATDGVPAGCSDVSDEAIFDEAEAAAAAGVNLYAIAIDGADVAFVNDLAQAGGTTGGLDVTEDIAQFQGAMDAIRDANLGCSFTLPDPADGEFDKHQVNVTIDDDNKPIELSKATSAAACNGSTSWYYDDENDPTSIHLCEETCAAYGNTESSISIVFGCPTKLY